MQPAPSGAAPKAAPDPIEQAPLIELGPDMIFCHHESDALYYGKDLADKLHRIWTACIENANSEQHAGDVLERYRSAYLAYCCMLREIVKQQQQTIAELELAVEYPDRAYREQLIEARRERTCGLQG